ncbi:hypothetical protein [Kordiimonas sp.]|uniref:hypothetical protein n=1 Tax=Kordiimonas sp. TaxID=1970157 RepID=UPI003A8D4AB2
MTANTIPWTKLPTPPPGISALYDFPDTPLITQVAYIPIPPQTTTPPYMTGMQITVTAQWLKLLAVSCSPSTPFSKSITVTKGTSSSTTTTESFSASLGVAGKLGSISAKLSDMTSQTITFTKSETIETTFAVNPKKHQTAVVWWQPVYTYHLRGVQIYHPGSSFPKTVPINATIVHYHQEYVGVQFPETSSVSSSKIASFVEITG